MSDSVPRDTHPGEGPEPGSGEGHRSELSGSAAGHVVRARDVQGGVHFHDRERAARSVPRQLPGDVRGFVNRVADLSRLDAVLAVDVHDPHVTAVTLVAGTAGVGKTSLAIHWAHRVRDRFPDGQLYVNLRGYDPGTPLSPADVLDHFLRVLEVPPAAIPADLHAKSALYRSLVADQGIMIVLDNAATVGQVRPLLPGTASCLVVVTSRSSLPGLVARDGARRLTLDTLPDADAVTLLRSFVDGYRTGDSDAELAELARLCARLPLALRIAAERAAARPRMPLGELIQGLRDESSLWDSLSADDGDEADAVRTVFAWSYRALPGDAARMFRLLGLHPGAEFCVPAAAALAAVSVTDARHLLDVLVGVHLLEQVGHDRYQFHDLLRAYATDQAHHEESAFTQHAALRQVVTWYLHTADAAATAMGYNPQPIPLDPPGPDVSPLGFTDYDGALGWYELERGNLVAATRAAADARLDDLAWRLPGVLREIYGMRYQFDDWLTTGRIGLDAVRRLGDGDGEALMLHNLGMVHRQLGHFGEAADHHRAALAIRRELGDRDGEARLLNAIGLVLLQQRRMDLARSHFEQAMAVADQIGNGHWSAIALVNLGTAAFMSGDLTDAQDLLHRALAFFREAGNRYFECESLQFLAGVQRELGDAEARSSIEQALDIALALKNTAFEALALLELGRVHLAADEATDALVCFHRSATVYRNLGDRGREAQALDATGVAYRQLGRVEESAGFHRRAAVMLRDHGDRWTLATVLNNLAGSLSDVSEESDARQYWREAVSILGEFADPRAAALRDSIEQRLPAPGS